MSDSKLMNITYHIWYYSLTLLTIILFVAPGVFTTIFTVYMSSHVSKVLLVSLNIAILTNAFISNPISKLILMICSGLLLAGLLLGMIGALVGNGDTNSRKLQNKLKALDEEQEKLEKRLQNIIKH